MTRGGSPRWEPVIPAALLVWGVWSAFGPMLASGLDLGSHVTGGGFAKTPGDLGDSRFVHYILEHVTRWSAGRAELWSPPIFYPATNTLAFSHVLVSVAPFYVLPRLLGVSPTLAFQTWYLLVGVAGFVATYLLLSRPLGMRPLAAGGGALLFAFGSPRLCQLNHAQMWTYFFGVGAVYALARVFGGGPSRLPAWAWIQVLAMTCALQLWADFYPGWFLGLSLSLAALLACTRSGMRRALAEGLLGHARAWIAAALLGVALVLPLASHYLTAVKEVGYRSFGEILPMIPRPVSWLYMGSGSWLYGWMNRLGVVKELQAPWEHALGIGLVTGVLVLAGFVGARDRTLPVLVALTSLALVVLFSGPVWPVLGPYVPGSGAVKAVGRVGVFLLLTAAIGLGLSLSRVRRPSLALAALLVVAAEQRQARLVMYDTAVGARGVSAVAAAIDRSCGSFYYVSQAKAQGFAFHVSQLDAMWASLVVNVPTVNGYSGNLPREWGPLQQNRLEPGGDDTALRAAVAAWMRAHGAADRRVCWVALPDPRSR